MPNPRKLILTNAQSPGDIVMLTAAVRDLHQCYPGQFLTDVRTPYPDLWANNPHLTPLEESDPEVEKIDCSYPLIHQSNTTPYHFIHGFIAFLNDKLGLQIKPTLFKGDIHLTEEEKRRPSQVADLLGEDRPYWIINAGGKYDFTAKWWDAKRFQEVVNFFRGKIQFVQVGQKGHYHPKLEHVIDLRGKTSLRKLVLLTHHAQGVLTPVSLPMHLAAAVEIKKGRPKNRACVVIAGGREPVQWEAYPHHQFLHTNGALFCCDNGGCWKRRVKPLKDGSEHDRPEYICVDVRGHLPRCMDMITSGDVIRSIETYYKGGSLKYLRADGALSYLIPKPLVLNGKENGRRKLSAGVVIGHYNNIMALQLNIRAIRDTCGDVPILICDDCSDGYAPTPSSKSVFGQLWRLAYQEPNVYLWPNPTRIGHSGGDCSAVWKGIMWAKHMKLDAFAKLSQRFIITIPKWLPDATEKLMASDAVIMGKKCNFHGFPIRTESMVFKTEAWYRHDVLAHLTPRKLNFAFEYVLWDDVRDRFNNKMLTWDILSDSRPEKAEGILFREPNSKEEYQVLAQYYDVPWDRSFNCLDSNKMSNYIIG